MNEREYHDHHYAEEAPVVQASPLFERIHERTVRQFLRHTGAGGAHRVLSLGCGSAAIECLLARHVREVVGVDISSVAVEQAHARARAAGLRNVSFLVSPDGDPQIEGLGRFDVVAAFAFLHHLDDTAIRKVLHAAGKALRLRGLLYSADPSSRRLVRFFAGLVRETYDRYHSPDERELEPERLASLAAEAGFPQQGIGYTDYFLGPLAWLAPGTPRWLAGPLEALDNVALKLPIIRRYASSFSLVARFA